MNYMRRTYLILLGMLLAMMLSAGSALAESGTVKVDDLKLRKEASTKSAVLQTLNQGDEVEIIRKDGSWYKVRYGKYNGYVYASYIKVSEEKSVTLKYGDYSADVMKMQERLKELGYFEGTCMYNFGEKTQAAVKEFQGRNGLTQDGVAGKSTLDKLYSTNAVKAAGSTLRYGDYSADVMKMQERLKELGYFEGTCMYNFGEKTQAAVKEFQGRNGLTQDGVAGKSTLDKLYSANAVKAADSALRYGDYSAEVKKLQERLKELGYFEGVCLYNYGDKTKAAVKEFQGRNGLTQDGVAGKSTLDKLYSANAVKAADSTLRYGDYSAEVKKLQERLKELGYFEGTCLYNFGDKTKAAVKAFQKANGLTQDGVAGKSTLEKLYSSSAIPKEKTFVTERLDWFKYGKIVFPHRAIIKIKDCSTGLVFDAKVLYGTNHLDAEPLTAADTKTLLSINGGVDFSYHRRAVLVQYNGHVYAASIYCEPHGDQTILDNDFEGQFCLHFYGSKTHGTDRVDEDHKACEERALRETW